MKYLVFSDMHLHNWQYGANYSNGWNSRLLAQKNVLDQIYDCIVEHNIEEVFFCGDLFHTHGKVDAACLTVAAEFFDVLKQKTRAQVTVLVGNHDFADKSGRVNSLSWLLGYDNVHLIQDTVTWDHPRVVAISYMEDKEKLQSILKEVRDGYIVFLHQGVSGVPVGSDFVIPNEILTPDMIPSHVKHVFTGHYHTHKNVNDKLTIVGAPMQHTWADSGEDRGWLIVDSMTGKYERVLSRAPRFVKVGPFEKSESVEGNYVRAEYHVDPENQDDSRKRLLQKGALSVEFSYKEKKEHVICDEQVRDFNLNNVIDKFQKTNGLDEKAIKIGEQLRSGTYEIS